MNDVVLVHGSTQTATGFWRLRDALERRGHRTLTVDVPSAGPASSIEYAELLAAQLPTNLHRPIVAAHSASGLLLPALADRLDASHQVWIAAAVADYAGRCSLLSETRAEPAALFTSEWLGTEPTTDAVLATYFLFHDADLGTLQQALPTVAQCDLSVVYAETPPVDPAARPSTYLLPVDDRALTRAGMSRMARKRLHVNPDRDPGRAQQLRRSPRTDRRRHPHLLLRLGEQLNCECASHRCASRHGSVDLSAIAGVGVRPNACCPADLRAGYSLLRCRVPGSAWFRRTPPGGCR